MTGGEKIIEKVEFAEWATPIAPVIKPDCTVRICGVNKVASSTPIPCPTSTTFLPHLQEDKNCPSLTLPMPTNKFHLRNNQETMLQSIHTRVYTVTIIYHLEWPQHQPFFQRAMDGLLQDIEHVTVYLDDILVTAKTKTDHLRNFEEVLSHLEKAGIHLKKSKCAFMLPSVEYLGHTISAKGLPPTTEKVRAIMDALTLQDVSQLRSFLGLINYYG